MKLNKIFTVLACAAILALAAGQAQAGNDFFTAPYVKAELGGSYGMGTGDMKGASSTNTPFTLKGNDLGFAAVGGAGAGIRLYRNVRLEGMLNYRYGHKLDTYDTSAAAGEEKVTGDVDSIAAFMNMYYDIPHFKLMQSKLIPFVMVGLGAARNTVSGGKWDFTRTGGDVGSISDDTKYSFAWQAGVGAGYALSKSWTLDASYRYVDLGTVATLKKTALTVNQKEAEGNYRTQEVLLGLRWSF